MAVRLPDLPTLTESERSCLRRYLSVLIETVGRHLAEVVLFGSVARGQSWPLGMPIRSDLDLLVVTDSPLPEDVVEMLINRTLPLFLESGRQIAPQFRTRDELVHPRDARAAGFVADVERDGIGLYRRGDSMT